MKKTLLILLAAAIVGVGVTPTDVEAASKKKPVAAKKKTDVVKKKAPRVVRQIRAKKVMYVKRAKRSVTIEDVGHLALQSSAVLVQDQATGAILFEKNASAVLPIASITKLMTAMVVLDAKPDLTEVLAIADEDVDLMKGTRSRLKVGTRLEREEMLRLALMSSENRAAAALSRNYPGGREAFVVAMNAKAQALGLVDTRFFDPTGLTASNVSSPRDLAKMVNAAHHYPLIREFSTTSEGEFSIAGRSQQFHNTNTLVNSPTWEIGLSKTGYINEAGKCLVMQAWLNKKPTIIVLLDSWGRMTRIGDANRIKRWVENTAAAPRQSAG
jgi:D-alanyl-D-alanine endopeptidase (penicillin-binding protein 7)